MDTLSQEEYLRLIEQLVEQQYDDLEASEDIEWIPAESEIVQRLKLPDHNKVLNLTNIKKSEIEEQLLKCRNIRMGSFLIKISRYHGELAILGHNAGEVDIGMDVCIYEEQECMHLNRTSKMTTKLNVCKDTRFDNRPWLKYFNSFKIGQNIPMDTAADIVRWLQAITRMSAFV